MRNYYYPFFLFISVFLVACNPSDKPDQYSSLSEINPLVAAYSSGVLSIADPIIVTFTEPMVTEEKIGESPDQKALQITPAVNGKSFWEDNRTLRFVPDQYLSSATTYKVNVALSRLHKKAKGDNAQFDFEFQTKEQHLSVELDILKAPQIDNLKEQELVAKIFAADAASEEDLQKTVQAFQNGKALNIEWTLDQQQFLVKGIQRGNEPSSVEVKWNGKAINTDDRGTETIEVPALSDFKVTKVEVSHDPEQSIRIQFSDPILQRQDLSGLIAIKNYEGQLRFVIDGNEVRAYPSTSLAGDYEVSYQSGIKNTGNARMPAGGASILSFEEAKPKVRLVGRGVIMPNSDGVLFPFEAIGLNAIELEVFKVYNNNILQFFQSNKLTGAYDLNAVGKIIIQKKVDLQVLNPNGNAQRWTRYALDLSKLFEEDSKAIYQVRIGFRPSYSMLECDNTSDDDNTVAANPFEEEEIERSIMDSWYGIDGYNNDYDWENRDNPCFPEYYNSERFVQRNVLASNFGIIAKMGQDQSLTTIVTDLRSTEPLANTEVSVYDFQQQLIGSGNTDADGIANIKIEGEPFLVLAKKGPESGYLRLMDGDALSLSRFDTKGVSIQKGVKGYLYGERGVWRPGDSVFLNFVLDDRANPLPENYPLNFELYDARGQLYFKRSSSAQVNNVYPLHFGTEVDAPTGNWRAEVRIGGATFRKVLKIETIKPNRMEIDLDFGEATLAGREEINGALSAKWLHGAPASNLKATVEVQLSSSTTTFDKYPSFKFDDPARKFRSYGPKTIFENDLDAAGSASFSTELLGNQSVPGRLRANFKTRVFEQGGDFSTDAFSLPYSPFNAYAGLEIPTNEYGEPRIDVDENGQLRFVVLDDQGRPMANRELSVGFYRVNWRWWWDQGDDYVTRYNTTQHNNAETRTELQTNNNGEASWSVKPARWGRYLVRVCDLEGGHCSGSYLYAGYPWNDNDDDDSGRELASMLNFKSDKANYTVGEEVTLTIPSAKAGRALVTLESGSKVIDRFWTTAKDGPMEIKFKASADMAPTIYAHVNLIQAHAQTENDLPIRLYGVIPIRVENPDTKLEPVIAMPESLRPEQSFAVEVSEQNKKGMAYTLAVVDEGLLGLTRFKTPNPHTSFYAREALGVKTWDVYDQVLGAYGGEFKRLLSIGGDGEIDRGELDNTANRFAPVVKHYGPFKLGAGKKNKHEITLPNYVGAVRVMVVAAENGAYGNAEKRVPVKNPLMVLSTLPRVLSPGDEFKLPVNVFVTDAKVRDVRVQIKESSGLVDITSAASQRLSFSGTGDQLTTFSVKVKDGVGIAKFEINASGNGESARQEVEIQIRNPNPFQTDVIAEVLEPGKNWETNFAAIGMEGTNQAILEVSSIPPINLGRRLNYLLRYPYGCIEQTTSAAFPQLYVDRLMELSEDQKTKIPENIKGAIKRIRSFQTSNGGFAYWPGNTTPDQWGSNYAGHFLLEAKANGYDVPASMLDKWIKFQKKAARLWSPKQAEYGFYSASSQQLTQAYRLYTLAMAGKADLSAMNRLREAKDLGSQAKWRLAAAYALTGKDQVARQLTNGLSTEVTAYQELSYTYGSAVRDQAMILETASLLKETNKAGQLVQDLSTSLSQQGWMSTQTTAYALMSMAKYLGETSIDDGVQFDYQYAGARKVGVNSKKPVFQIDLGNVNATQNKIELNNQSGAKLFTRLVVSGQPKPGNERGLSKDLKIQVRYTDKAGNSILPERLEQGQDFFAIVEVTHPNTRLIRFKELALDQVFPSGWEIINSRMDNIQAAQQSAFDYQDIRDDRVNTFFSLDRGKSKTYRVQLNAAYQGRFYLPATACGAMYDNTINAFETGQWVEVVAPSSL